MSGFCRLRTMKNPSLSLLVLLTTAALVGAAAFARLPAVNADDEAPSISLSPVIAHGGPDLGEGEELPTAQASCSAPGFSGATAPDIRARSWVVYDPTSQTFLAGEHENRRRFPASLTKIATALVAIEHGPLDRQVVVDVDWSNRPTSARLGLQPGTETTLNDLLVGMLTVSGNDAAEELAAEIAGDQRYFVDLMNERAAEIGMDDTHFANPHGLDEETHLSTAHDLALLAAEAMRHDRFRTVVGSSHSSIEVGAETWDLANTNGLLNSFEGATGIKTGTTRGAGMSLAASAERNGHEVIAVLLNSPDRFGESAALLDWAFAEHAWNC